MKILKRYDTILNYAINPSVFKDPLDLEKIYYDCFQWTLEKDDVCLLKYNVFYDVKDKNTRDHFIKFHKETQLFCLIKDKEIKNDAEKICKIKTEIYLETKLFLEQNTFSFYKILGFVPMFPFLDRIEYEERKIRLLKGIIPFSEMSDGEKEIFMSPQSISNVL